MRNRRIRLSLAQRALVVATAIVLLVAGVKKIIVVMDHNSKAGDPKFIPECTLPLTGQNVVDMIITNLGVFHRPDHENPFELIELAPGVTLREVGEKTTAHYIERVQ